LNGFGRQVRPRAVNVVRAWLPLAAAAVFSALAADKRPVVTEYFGTCDASAAVPLGSDRFLVASDEDSVLRLYRLGRTNAPEQVFDVTGFLDLDYRHPESDIEGAALVGDVAYWISSHARSVGGKVRESRSRFFATRIATSDTRVTVTPIGRPYRYLLADMETDAKLAPCGLASAAGLAARAPGALNIEGLCATPDGTLLIGFRSPVPQGRALLLPLLNPAEVVLGQQARFGPPIELRLGGFGVRDMALVNGRYVIIGGASGSGGQERLFFWDGNSDEANEVNAARFKGLQPEVVIGYPGKGLAELQVLSDDGARRLDGCPCKDLPDPQQRRFRSVWVRPKKAR